MKTKILSRAALQKLKLSSLFVTYRKAFELAMNCRLEISSSQEKKGICVPVKHGEIEICYLLVTGLVLNNETDIKSLLKCFSAQLSEEINTVMIEAYEEEAAVVKKAKAFMREHVHERMRLDKIANVVGICSFQLCRLFKENTGLTMTEYISRYRVEHARKKLINPFYQVAEVGRAVGFTSLSQFNRNFLKYTGQSPTEYRESLRSFEHCNLTFA